MLSTIEQLREQVKSPEYRRRTVQALAETRALVAKEMRHSPDLRKPEYLAGLNAHVAKLESVLA